MECVTELGGWLIVFPPLRAIHIFTLGRPTPIVASQTFHLATLQQFQFLANARQLIKVEIPHQSHFFQMRVCQRAVFAKDRVPSADIYDHCLELRHLPYCHFFAGPLYLLLILHCPHVKGGGRHGAIIKPSAQQTLGMTRLKRAGNASSGRFDIETLKTKQEKSEVRTKQLILHKMGGSGSEMSPKKMGGAECGSQGGRVGGMQPKLILPRYVSAGQATQQHHAPHRSCNSCHA